MATTTVLKKEADDKRIMSYTPLIFGAESTNVIQTYQKAQDSGSDFRMSEIVKEQTGIKEVEEKNIEELVQQRLVEKLQAIQESAYQEAYNLGLHEGTQKAFSEMKHQIESGLAALDNVLQKIHNLKIDLVNSNERHLVSLSFHMAKLLALKEVSAEQAHILKIIKSAVQMAQNEEDVKIHISSENYHFIQALIDEGKKDVDFMKKMKVEARTDLGAGDCVIETNYGQVDSRIEQRAQTLWNELGQVMPSAIETTAE